MKNLNLITITFLLIASVSYAQWQPDDRLTNDPDESYTYGYPVASNGNIVHVVWYDNRSGNWEIHHKRSTDAGVNWSSPLRLTNNSANSISPSVAITGQVVHVVWQDERDGNYEIYYKRSPDAGIGWGNDIRLTSYSASSLQPSISVSGQVLHVVWDDQRNGPEDIYYKRSSDGGLSWGVDTRLTTNSDYQYSSVVCASGQVVHVAWMDFRDGNFEIYYKRSADAGLSWGSDERLTTHGGESSVPSISASGQTVYVVWQDNRDGNFEIYCKRSTNGGLNWGAAERLTNNSQDSKFPVVSVSNQTVHLVWRDERDGNKEIYYKRSLDGGISWGNDTRLTNNSSVSDIPSVSISSQTVHVLWMDERDGNFEVYYKRNPNGNPVSITNISSETPKDFMLSQNYPNPFNPVTNINFSITKADFVKLIVYDITGREITELVNEQLNAGRYNVDFDATALPSGTYFYRLTAGDFTQTKKMILIK